MCSISLGLIALPLTPNFKYRTTDLDETSTRGRLTYGGYSPEQQTDPAAHAPMNIASFGKSTRSKLNSTCPLLCSSRGGYAQNRKSETRKHSIIRELERPGYSVQKIEKSARQWIFSLVANIDPGYFKLLQKPPSSEGSAYYKILFLWYGIFKDANRAVRQT